MLFIETIKRIKEVLPAKFKKRGVLAIILLFINSILELLGLAALLPLFTVILTENIIQENDILNNIYTALGFASENIFIIFIAGSVVGLIIIKNVIGIFIQKYQTTFSFDIMEYFMLKLHKYYYQKGFMFFKETNSNLISRDVFSVPRSFAQHIVLGTFNLLNELILLTLIVLAIVIYNPIVLLLLIVTIVPVFWVFYSKTKNIQKHIGEEVNRISPIIAKNIFHSIFGYVDVIINGTAEFFENRMKKNMGEFKRLNINTVVLNLVPTKIIESTMVFAIFAIIVYGLYFLPNKGSLITLLGLYAVAAYRIMPSVNRIMIALNGLNSQGYTIDVVSQVKSFRFEGDKVKTDILSFKKEIKLKNISFKYPNASEHVINNFNLVIKKGEVIGVRGQSGGGKTTLMNIVLGFLEVSSGTIEIDGVAIDKNNVAAWQQKLGYVQQEVYLLDATLAENIAFGIDADKIDEKKVRLVLEQASLSALVSDLEYGISTKVGERGAQLSGGQRQRVGIARALYFDAEVLFFDEATSALDPQTEIEINQSIKKLSQQGLTMMIIAHRETSLEEVDRILEM